MTTTTGTDNNKVALENFHIKVEKFFVPAGEMYHVQSGQTLVADDVTVDGELTVGGTLIFNGDFDGSGTVYGNGTVHQA